MLLRSVAVLRADFPLERGEIAMLPDPIFWQMLPLSIMMAGLAIMLRSHRLLRIIVVMMVGTIVLKFIPALVGGGWGRIVVAIFTVYLGMGLLRRFLTAFLGPEAGGHVLGTWVLRITDVVFLLPFRILRWLVGGR